MKQPFLKRLTRFFAFFRYIAGCACGLTIKLVLTALFDACGFSIRLSYFLTHCFLLFSSFFFHYFITFQRKYEGFRNLAKTLAGYTATVVSFKGLDYLIVTCVITGLEQHFVNGAFASWQQKLLRAAVIVASSGVLFFLRYFCFRFLLHKKKPQYFKQEKDA